MRCGACGGPYTKISRDLFGCTTAREKGTCDNRLNIRTDTLEATVLDGLRDRLMEPELFKVFAMEFHGWAADLACICHAHPALADAVHEAALAVDKRAIHKAN